MLLCDRGCIVWSVDVIPSNMYIYLDPLFRDDVTACGGWACQPSENRNPFEWRETSRGSKWNTVLHIYLPKGHEWLFVFHMSNLMHVFNWKIQKKISVEKPPCHWNILSLCLLMLLVVYESPVTRSADNGLCHMMALWLFQSQRMPHASK